MIADRITVEITSADIPGMLHDLSSRGVELRDMKHTDRLTVRCTLNRRDYQSIHNRLLQRGDRITPIQASGMLCWFQTILSRPILLLGAVFITILSVFLPTRVLFVEVQGNSILPEQLILERADACGISFGASRREVRSEKVKNNLLSVIPELQWAGINTKGCVAIISVEERTETSDNEQQCRISSIVASDDGIITECVVRRGNLLCQVGQAVRAGEVLVSGYTDCGLTIRATNADAEIMANTTHSLQAVTPVNCSFRGDIREETVKFSLAIGKKLINFYKDSGISDTTCVKMYSKKYLTLPGGRRLPLAFIVTRETSYQNSAMQSSPDDVKALLESDACHYLATQMVSGQILHSNTVFYRVEDHYVLQGSYACSEMIGRVLHEESFHNDGKNN